jgi:SpoIID/LytB domain protein
MVTLRGAGWGHGAGLCQIGALGMGLTGHDVDTICRHYYPNADLETAYL